MDANDPRMAAVECAIARVGYEHGRNGIQIAEQWIHAHVHAVLTVQEGRAANPMAFPGYGDGTAEEAARRIVARLLDAGWRPPDSECLDLPGDPSDIA
ncbi:hypothetical protein [Streptomyces candidus]|uniref:Uncharacterized protein n=1 Tax=Streptomyces candidus TaxID=67283 RepID=A0A7X0HPS3_9ACTN|nr:hypothetical protein [Streptomyces candidus]MBB6440257.1 hypothetical protein [Streptomyces candidus]GHH58158.1 hypothetical protein GCM10018773_66250 [Streptomyces candidus]